MSFLRGGKESLRSFFGVNFGHIQLIDVVGKGKERRQITDYKAAILNSIVSNRHYGMLRGHPIIAI